VKDQKNFIRPPRQECQPQSRRHGQRRTHPVQPARRLQHQRPQLAKERVLRVRLVIRAIPFGVPIGKADPRKAVQLPLHRTNGEPGRPLELPLIVRAGRIHEEDAEHSEPGGGSEDLRKLLIECRLTTISSGHKCSQLIMVKNGIKCCN
jgi:hypothetical protein